MAKRSTVAKLGEHVVSLDQGLIGLKKQLAGLLFDQETIGRLLTVNEVADLLQCSKSSLDKWRLTGDGPRFVRVGARVRYRPADIAAYIAEQTRTSTSGEIPPAA